MTWKYMNVLESFKYWFILCFQIIFLLNMNYLVQCTCATGVVVF